MTFRVKVNVFQSAIGLLATRYLEGFLPQTASVWPVFLMEIRVLNKIVRLMERWTALIALLSHGYVTLLVSLGP